MTAGADVLLLCAAPSNMQILHRWCGCVEMLVRQGLTKNAGKRRFHSPAHCCWPSFRLYMIILVAVYGELERYVLIAFFVMFLVQAWFQWQWWGYSSLLYIACISCAPLRILPRHGIEPLEPAQFGSAKSRFAELQAMTIKVKSFEVVKRWQVMDVCVAVQVAGHLGIRVTCFKCTMRLGWELRAQRFSKWAAYGWAMRAGFLFVLRCKVQS